MGPYYWSKLKLSYRFILFIVYKAQFPKTLPQLREGEPYVKKMVGGLSVLLALSVVFFVFLRKYGKYYYKTILTS